MHHICQIVPSDYFLFPKEKKIWQQLISEILWLMVILRMSMDLTLNKVSKLVNIAGKSVSSEEKSTLRNKDILIKIN